MRGRSTCHQLADHSRALRMDRPRSQVVHDLACEREARLGKSNLRVGTAEADGSAEVDGSPVVHDAPEEAGSGGILTADELLAEMKYLRRVFDAIDVDGSGVIGLRSVRSFFDRMARELHVEKATARGAAVKGGGDASKQSRDMRAAKRFLLEMFDGDGDRRLGHADVEFFFEAFVPSAAAKRRATLVPWDRFLERGQALLAERRAAERREEDALEQVPTREQLRSASLQLVAERELAAARRASRHRGGTSGGLDLHGAAGSARGGQSSSARSIRVASDLTRIRPATRTAQSALPVPHQDHKRPAAEHEAASPRRLRASQSMQQPGARPGKLLV